MTLKIASAITLEEIILFKKVKNICRAVDHPLRKLILARLIERGETTVTELYVALDLEQSVASSHLKILRDAKFVKARRDNRFVYYSFNADRTTEYINVFKTLFY